MTDIERMIAVCHFDKWHRELDHPDYDHACEHRPWEKNAYVAGYDKAKREMEDIINRAYRRSKDGYLITIAEIIGVVIREETDRSCECFKGDSEAPAFTCIKCVKQNSPTKLAERVPNK